MQLTVQNECRYRSKLSSVQKDNLTKVVNVVVVVFDIMLYVSILSADVMETWINFHASPTERISLQHPNNSASLREGHAYVAAWKLI
jgi:hypothetical protein